MQMQIVTMPLKINGMEQKPDQITLTEAEELTGVSRETLARAARKKLLSATMYGKTWVTTKAAVELWIKEYYQPKKGWKRST